MTDKHDIVARPEVSAPMAIMHPLVERMLAASPTPESLEKILNLQREYEKDQAEKAYASALVELKRDLPPFLNRDKVVDFTGQSGKRTYYTHTSLAGAMETVTPLLSNYGFSMTWKPGTTEKGLVKVTAKLMHRQGHSETATLESAPESGGNKSGPQAVASSVTLLARYACLGLLGLATGDMKEPQAQPDAAGDRVDTARNIKAMAAAVKAGKSKADAERVAGKPMGEWTSVEIEKIRAWLIPAPAQTAAPTDAKITKEAAKTLKGIMDGYKMKPEAFSALIEEEIGRKLAGGAMDLNTSEYEALMDTFEMVDSGAYSLTAGKIVRPA